MNKIEILYQSERTIFRIEDIRQLWKEDNPTAVKSSIKYFADKGSLHRLRKGLYSLNAEYRVFDVACKLITPSYISLHAALLHYGIIFQHSETTTCFANYHRELVVDKHHYLYHAMPNSLFYNPMGIIQKKHYTIASPERAICDWINLYGLTSFDNTRDINPQKVQELVEMYPKKTTKKRLQKLLETL
jgi:predicted transcriptional regulator of viral defense system